MWQSLRSRGLLHMYTLCIMITQYDWEVSPDNELLEEITFVANFVSIIMKMCGANEKLAFIHNQFLQL